MVGVPGKYRGCETCRGRRVKCGNERPFCKRCVDSSRPCTYERETVFIVASIEDGGRCSSHPPRKTSKKAKSKSPSSKSKSPSANPQEVMQLVAEEPLAPAWNDFVTVSDRGRRYNLQIAALRTKMSSVVRGPEGEEREEGGASVGFAPYEVFDVRPSMGGEDFQMQARALAHISKPVGGGQVEGGGQGIQVDGFFLFLFEHNNSLAFNLPPWKDPNPIRQQGPENFRTFPNHHFFVRVYRPQAILSALLNRKPTFLSEPPWMTSPFEHHPKSPLDLLLDVILPIPALLQRADHIATQPPTLSRRLLAQDLLQNCLTIESHLDQWQAAAGAPYWIQQPPSDNSHLPFPETYSFPDGLTALAFISLWTAQALFFPVIERLHWTVYEPVLDGPFPPPLVGDPSGRYGRKAVRAAAEGVCRALDFALERTVQPDMLVVPLAVAREVFELGDGGGMEEMWCEGFRGRLEGKGGEMREVVMGGGWWDVKGW